MKYWIDFGALALLYVRVLFRKWRSRGKDVLLVNTLMYVYLSFVLIKKQKNTVLPNLPPPFRVSGNRNPNGIVMITFNATCLKKSPLPAKTSVNGSKFMGL